MSTRDYYVVLGVPRSESGEGIRSAFRDLVKQYHPDRTGSQGAAAFREIVEAYLILSDPRARRLYDDRLKRPEQGEVPARTVFAGKPPPEPLVSEPVPLFDDPESIHPSLEEMFDRFCRNFTRLNVPKAERVEPLHCEVVLSPQEAAAGGVLPIGVPVFSPCPSCGGSGRDWLFPCLRCGQRGMLEDTATVRLRIPPMVRSGAVIDIPLESLGVENFYLRILIRIGG
jgi:DnaJ-class molecular chaperone